MRMAVSARADATFVARLLDGAHTWTCPNGHQNVTWEQPPPAVGGRKSCGPCWHPSDARVRIVWVAPGLPLAKVRELLGRDVAAGVLAAGGATMTEPIKETE